MSDTCAEDTSNAVVGPATRLRSRLLSALDDLPLRRKLQIAYGLFLLPIAFLIHVLVTGASVEVDRIQRELDGSRAIEAVRRLQHAYARLSAGAPTSIIEGAYRAVEPYAGNANVERHLSGLRSAMASGAVADVVRETGGVISAVADAAGLTLDTELPTFRLQDLISTQIPEVVKELAVVANLGGAPETLPAQQANPLLAAYKLEFALDRLSGAIAASVAAGVHRSGKVDVARLGATARDRVHAAATPASRKEAVDDALTALDELAQTAATSLDTLLRNRIASRQGELVAQSATAVALFLAGIAFVVLVERRVVGPLADVTRALHALAAGRAETRIEPTMRSDEIGGITRGALAFRQSLELARELKATANTAQERLAAAIERLTDFVALFDGDDRLVIANSAYGETHASVATSAVPGATFEQIARSIAYSGAIVGAKGREEAWLRERVAIHRAGTGPIELHHADGRWFLVYDHRLPDGSTLAVGTNITPLKEAMARAESEHARLVDAIDSLPALFNLFDARERLVVTNVDTYSPNAKEAELLKPGVSAQTLGRELARRRWIAASRDREDAWFEQRLALFRGGNADFVEEETDGRYFRVIQRRTREGGTISIRIDISREKHAERDAAERQHRLSAILDNAPMAIFLKDRENRYVLNNRRHAEWFVEPGRSIVGLRDSDFLPAGDAARLTESDSQMLRTGGVMVYERPGFKSGGPVEHVLVTKFPIVEADGAITGIAGFILDITDRKKAEERRNAAEAELRAVMDHTVDGLITIDARGTVQSFSRPAERIFGYRADAVLGRNVSMLMPEPYRSAHDGYLAAYMSTGLARIIGIGREVEGQRQDGTTFPMDLAVGEIPSVGGDRRFVGTVRDITARKAMETRLMQAHRLEAMGQITGGVAHDFNNILAAILMNLEILQQAAKGVPDMIERFQAASRATIRGRSLTRQLLAVAGRQNLVPKLVNVEALFADMARLLEASVGQTVRLAFDVAPGSGEVLADPGSLESALLNLVLNARDASTEGSVITIAARPVTVGPDHPARLQELHPGNYVGISVHDTGTGMSPEVVARAAEPFFTTKAAGKGTGLGLSMVFGFARQSGGQAVIDTAPGRGTTVTIYLPRPGSAQLAYTGETPLQRAARASAHILLVEDDADVRQALSAQLAQAGYRVTEAAKATEALARLDVDGMVDLVLSDIVMPGAMNGVQMAEAMRLRRPDLPVVFMSGFVGNDDMLRRAAALRCPVLAKPFTDTELTAALDAALPEQAQTS